MYRLYLYMYMYKPNLYILYIVHLAYSSSKPFQTCPAHSPHLGPPLVIFRTRNTQFPRIWDRSSFHGILPTTCWAHQQRGAYCLASISSSLSSSVKYYSILLIVAMTGLGAFHNRECSFPVWGCFSRRYGSATVRLRLQSSALFE